MNENRTRSQNYLPLAKIAFAGLAIGIVGVELLFAVNRRNVDIARGRRVNQFEAEIRKMDAEIEIVSKRVMEATSREALDRRFAADKGKLGGLQRITTDKVLYSGHDNVPVAADELRAVNNEGGAP